MNIPRYDIVAESDEEDINPYAIAYWTSIERKKGQFIMVADLIDFLKKNPEATHVDIAYELKEILL
jgi:hypothetical protein